MVVFKLLIGIVLVLYGANLLINTALVLGKKYKISEVLIGIVIIGFGTSLSELIVSIDAVFKNAAELSIGNIIGSNIANIFLVLGCAGIAKNLVIPKINKFDNIFHLMISLIFLLIFIYFQLNILSGLLFITLFFIYLFISFRNSKVSETENIEINNDFISKKVMKSPKIFGIPVLFVSIFLTIFGADLTVVNSIQISRVLGISEAVIGLTVIAIGTSLPEIAAGITAARKTKPDLIFGNIIGSNLYNILLILGFSSLLEQFEYNYLNLLDEIIFMFMSVVVFTILLLFKKSFNKYISLCFLVTYFVYIYFIYYKIFN
tara:strand:+ start:217 stop:1170 length:954 start_codon:yes stop_codon:yes gene_type:complete